MSATDAYRLRVAKLRLLDYITIDPDGCWLVKVGMTPRGYARMMVVGETDLVHRWSYRVFHGPIPEGRCVRHRCGVRNCANPDDVYVSGVPQEIVGERAWTS
jgi:hypothetical protein